MGYLPGKVLLGMGVEERGLLERQPRFVAPSTLLSEVWVLPPESQSFLLPTLVFGLGPGPRESSQRGYPSAPSTLCGSGRAHSQCSPWKAKDQGANPEDEDRSVEV